MKCHLSMKAAVGPHNSNNSQFVDMDGGHTQREIVTGKETNLDCTSKAVFRQNKGGIEDGRSLQHNMSLIEKPMYPGDANRHGLKQFFFN